MEANDKKWCVYIHHNMINNKSYIGITSRKNPNTRWSNGNGYKNNKHFYSAIQKYGWDNFEHIIWENNLTECEAKHYEILLIALFDTTNLNKGYNQSTGGEGASGVKKFGELNPFYGKHHSDETRKIISEKAKNRDKSLWNLQGLELGHGTRCWTEDTYKKISEANQGEKCATAKITEQDVIDILKMINNDYFYSEIREKYDISDAEISRIKNRIRWGYLYDKYPELYNFRITPKIKSIKQNNSSGILGVSWEKRREKWVAYIIINGNKKYLGYYVDKDDAIIARLIAEKEYFRELAPQKELFIKYNIDIEENEYESS